MQSALKCKIVGRLAGRTTDIISQGRVENAKIEIYDLNRDGSSRTDIPTNRQTDRQTDGQTDIQTDRRSDADCP